MKYVYASPWVDSSMRLLGKSRKLFTLVNRFEYINFYPSNSRQLLEQSNDLSSVSWPSCYTESKHCVVSKHTSVLNMETDAG